MKRSIGVFFMIFFTSSLQAQIYRVVDSTSRYTFNMEYSLPDDAEVAIDMDCDGNFDISFFSHLGGKFYKDWSRLSFNLHTNVEVLNSGTGLVTLLNYGDTIQLTDNLWTKNIDFIGGQGGMGNYGWDKIDAKYIAFRKKNANDTSYVFLKISTSGALMKIHKIILQCDNNPLELINETINKDKLILYPVPFNSHFTIEFLTGEKMTISIYDLSSRLILQQTFTNSTTVNLDQYPDGFYFYVLSDIRGKFQSGKVIKERNK